MKLPNLDRLVVPRDKIHGYLLSPTHRDGRHKAAVFMRFGFTAEAWEQLAVALVNHAMRYDVIRSEPSPFGVRHVIEGLIETPNGRSLALRAVWFTDGGGDVPRFVTAHPAKGAGS